MKRLLTYTAVALATLLLIVILWQFRQVVALFIASLLMAAVIRPQVAKLEQWGVPRATGQILLYFVGLGGLSLIVFLLGELFLAELNVTVNRLVLEYETLYRQWQDGTVWQQNVLAYLPPLFEYSSLEEIALEEMLPVVLTVARGITNAIGGLLLLMALSVYWSIDQHRFERLWLSLLPPNQRIQARNTWREVETIVGSYLRSQATQSFLAAILLGVGAALFGLRPMLFALIGALSAFIPLFGGLLAAFLGFGLGYLQGVDIGLMAAAYTLLVFIGLELFVGPRLWPREKHSFFLTILLIVPLVTEFAVWGLLLAPPLSLAIQVIIGQVYQAYLGGQATVQGLQDLEDRYEEIFQARDGVDTSTLAPETQNLASRLSRMLADVRALESE